MATGINIDPSISLAAKPPAAMSLSDMLNIARGAQLYQTERAVQPETIQQAQIATRTAGAQEQSAQTAAQTGAENLSQTRANRVFSIAGGFMNDPRIASGDPQKAVEAVLEMKKKAISTGVPEAQVEAIMAPIMATAAHNSKSLPQMLSNIIQSQLGAQGQQALQTGEVVTVGQQPGVYRPATRTIEPITFGAPPPQAGQPPAAQPPVGVTSQDMTAPIAGKQSERPALMYPVPQAGSPRPILPQEQFDQEAGSKFRDTVVNRQIQLSDARRNIQEVVSTARMLDDKLFASPGSFVGTMERKIRTQFGDTSFQQLAKDLANVRISNMQAMGQSLNTDAGKELMREATGDITYSPEILMKIARRADASNTELDLMANGLQRHSQLYGDANTKRYQQMWAANSDAKIFELINIARDIKDPAKRLELRNKLFGDMNDDQLAEINRKYKNLLKLSKTGDL